MTPPATRDVVVIGAGPAGCVAARELARRGRNVLLVDAGSRGRWKVCGGCLGPLGARSLDEIGLGRLLASVDAIPLRRTELHCRGGSLALAAGGMHAVSRSSLDAALADAAIDAGADALWNTTARLVWPGDQHAPARLVLTGGDGTTTIESHAVVLACGLSTNRADDPARRRERRGSFIGLGALSEAAPRWLEPGVLRMICARGGYVGCVRTNDGLSTWGAAVDPGLVRGAGSPARAVRGLCENAGVDSESVPTGGWRGTPRLTSRAPAQSGRVYRVGDAAGYVEPITGEGMSWAIAGAARLADVLDETLEQDRAHAPGPWSRELRGMLWHRRARCSLVAHTVRRPRPLALACLLSRGSPALSGSLARCLIGAPVRAETHGSPA